MRAWVLDQAPGTYRLGEVDAPRPGPGEVRVALVASAVNHMDLWLARGQPRPRTPHVPGADGAGVVDAVGERVAPPDVDQEATTPGAAMPEVGDEVVVNPAVSCRRCPTCLAGESPLCPRFAILGEHRWGTHAEQVVVPVENVLARPPGRSWEEAAAYGLCALTAWRMLRRARLRAGELANPADRA